MFTVKVQRSFGSLVLPSASASASSDGGGAAVSSEKAKSLHDNVLSMNSMFLQVHLEFKVHLSIFAV